MSLCPIQVCLSLVLPVTQGHLDLLDPKEIQVSQPPLALVHQDGLELLEVVELWVNQENQEFQVKCLYQSRVATNTTKNAPS